MKEPVQNQFQFKSLEEKLGVQFKKPELIELAFVHPSFLNENRDRFPYHNERLEFLGDAVLELVVTEYLYHLFPEKPEGELTSLRAALVKGEHLADVAGELEIGSYIYLSRGEEKSGGRHKSYILANTLEALIGAIHLDLGFATAHEFVNRFILKNLEKILEQKLHVDSKSRLQELGQEHLAITPHYDVLRESGPDHSKRFEVGAYLGDELYGKGVGSSKQNAEQAAARNALEMFETKIATKVSPASQK